VVTRALIVRPSVARRQWIEQRVENDCDGCVETYGPDGESAWTPDRYCPVHGLDAAKWMAELNRELDRRWPR